MIAGVIAAGGQPVPSGCLCGLAWLKPEAASLPGVGGEGDRLSTARVKAAPMGVIAEAVERTQGFQQLNLFGLFSPQGGDSIACLPQVLAGLLYRRQQDRVRADLYKNGMFGLQ